MPDTSGHVATRRDDLHTVTLRELEAQIIAAGIVMSRRQIMRHCKAGTFDAQKLPAVNNVEEWFSAPASIEKGIADIKTLQGLRSRRDATRRDMSNDDATEMAPKIEPDTSGHVATRLEVSEKQSQDEREGSEPDTSRHVAPDYDIYKHPYVKKLEDRVDKLEAKYEAQVRRTEEIQIQSQEKILELQRMTTIGQSKQLGDFLLQAKEWLIPGTRPTESREFTDESKI